MLYRKAPLRSPRVKSGSTVCLLPLEISVQYLTLPPPLFPYANLLFSPLVTVASTANAIKMERVKRGVEEPFYEGYARAATEQNPRCNQQTLFARTFNFFFAPCAGGVTER